ncbi:MAG: hypothetical protein ACKVY0_29635, partial [Prosthecobacter sp.]|uniref:hypothetical protein n=1 Tax=Prosthecobacter sp. TaxID=1965333 RepID=UPI0039030215
MMINAKASSLHSNKESRTSLFSGTAKANAVKQSCNERRTGPSPNLSLRGASLAPKLACLRNTFLAG